MSITDELRKEARGFGRYVYTAPQADCLTAIADRIDAEHEAACAEAYGNGVMSVPIALDESQWVKLPVDADGVPIRVGDVMEWCDSGETLTVDGIGRDVLFYIDGENAEWTAARNKRHHHEPTVEKERPDSLDRIADELEKWCDRVDVDGDACGKPRALVERIRRLAKKEGDYGPF